MLMTARSRSRAATAVLLGGAMIVAAPTAASAGPGGVAPAHRATLKPLISGVVDRDGPPPAALADVVDAYVVQVPWSRLQPRRHGLRVRVLDRALAEAGRSGSQVKLRVLAGVHAPRWAKHLGGPPVPLHDPHDGGRGTVPRFWTAAFGTAYAALQRRLAHRYDADPVLGEVVVSRCTTFYAEPFVRQTADAVSRTALRRAGYTAARDKRCHRQEIDAHRAWRTTRSGLALNPAQLVTRDGAATVDTRFTIAMMRYCRRTLSSRCVLENNSIRSPIAALGPNYERMYAAMGDLAPGVAFQTATAARMGSCADTLTWAADRGASYVEIPWNADQAGCTPEVLTEFSQQVG